MNTILIVIEDDSVYILPHIKNTIWGVSKAYTNCCSIIKTGSVKWFNLIPFIERKYLYSLVQKYEMIDTLCIILDLDVSYVKIEKNIWSLQDFINCKNFSEWHIHMYRQKYKSNHISSINCEISQTLQR